MPFEKGKSGFIGGNTSKRPVKGGIISALADKFGAGPAGPRRIAQELVDIALDKYHPKQFAALQEIVDRLDGKPQQAIIGDKDEDAIQHHIQSDLEIIKLYRESHDIAQR